MLPPATLRSSRKRFVGASLSALGAVAAIKTPARAAQFQFRCATSQRLEHPSSVRMTQMWAAIEKESGGRVHCDFFPGSVLGNDTAMFSQMRTGALHFLLVALAGVSAVVPVADIAFLGFAYKDSDEGARVMDGPVGDYVRKEMTAKGMHGLRSSWDSAMNEIGSNTHPIHTPDDLHGFKIRVQEGRITTSLFRALGASPTPLSLNEIYTSLQTHLIDGEGASLISIVTLRLFEVNKFVSMANYGWAGLGLVSNTDTWNSLPPDIQAIIERNNTKYAALERRDVGLLSASLADKIRRQGVTVSPVDQNAFRAPLKSYYEAWAAEFGPALWGLLQTSLGRKLT